mgnify:CR=1 FL=1
MKEIKNTQQLKSITGTGKWRLWSKIVELISMIFDYLGL